MEEKQSFYDELRCELDLHSADDLVMCLGAFSGHVGRHIDGFDEVHGWIGVGQRKLDGRKLLELSGIGTLCQIHGLRQWNIGG